MVDTGDLKSPDESRAGSSPAPGTKYGVVVQLVRISACHAEGRGFESRPLRQLWR